VKTAHLISLKILADRVGYMVKKLAKHIYTWVLLGIILGILFGYFAPKQATQVDILANAFLKFIKMLIAPIIFCTITLGIAKMQNMRKVGKVAGKAFLYFEVLSTIALLLGLVIVNVLKPGSGLNINPASLDEHLIANYVTAAHAQAGNHIILGLIPKSFFEPLVNGNILQVLLIAIFSGLGLARLKERAKPIVNLLEVVVEVFFKIINGLMWLAPFGAFGAMAYTIGKYGLLTLLPLLKLILCFYGTSLIFIVVVLGAVCKLIGVNIFKLLSYIKDELLLVLGTSSSESALAPIMQKLERLGCPKEIVGLVIPTGYSFNLDGTNIYITMAALFIAQALNIPLSLPEQLTLLFVAMLTSKGASGVTGAGFITLAATLAVVPSIPVVGIVLILGIDRFMSEVRSLTNFVGNTIATLAIAAWENELDRTALKRELRDASI
jgi:aerobic C4-dicarboxylate transport protein